MPDEVLVSPAELFGDGVFETVHLRPSGPWLLDAHLSRLARSAALLELDVLPLTLGAMVSDGPESALRIIRTRRSQHVTISPIPAETLRERMSGVRVISAGLGYALGGKPPWSLWAAKTLSYGSNFAARRWARERGADDLLWLSTEGYALESPTASLVWLTGDELCTVPPEQAQILPGTTAAHLLSVAPSVGLRPAHRLVTIEELRGADAIWLASALRGLAFVKSLDGAPRRTSRWTKVLLDLLGY
ncbi:aminotransferase class IV [Actinoplanes sp. KI2]|uniref:aminotransferase class IV n=1 Tax=Actinoplanes sp. KI2 TaxID=2983315 RepID=UPI0021D5AF70|nr:aminotransferase class IV [Actinoplanes sp. KI2]MCU7727164.1 aminotransferase class IV [Actinoplanes sp. KI2]